jgi:hypothetical protein
MCVRLHGKAEVPLREYTRSIQRTVCTCCSVPGSEHKTQHSGRVVNTPALCSVGWVLLVLYGCETWSLTLREEHRLRVFENRVLRRIFGPKRDEVTENGGSCTMRNFIICSHPQISLGKSSQGEWGGRGMWYAWERREKCTRFWWESPKDRDHVEDQGVGGKMGSEWMWGRLAWGGGWFGFDWLRTGTGGGLLWVRWWTFGFLRHGVS